MYKKRLCRECDGVTIAQDVCVKCRKKNYQKKEVHSSRAQVNEHADAILATPKEQAQSDYEFYKKLWMETNDEEALYRWKQARALLEREEIKGETLT